LRREGSTIVEGDRPAAPLLVIVCGKPATGKTTLGRRLAADLGLPFFSKDALKETLFDALGAADRAWSRRLGIGSFALLRHITETLLAAGQSLVVEANVLAAYDAPFYQSVATRHGARVAQIWLTADPQIIVQRFEQRAASAERHLGHVEQANMEEFRSALLHTDDAPLPLAGALFTVDTTEFATVEYAPLLDALRSAL
jgi:predicted kinase